VHRLLKLVRQLVKERDVVEARGVHGVVLPQLPLQPVAHAKGRLQCLVSGGDWRSGVGYVGRSVALFIQSIDQTFN